MKAQIVSALFREGQPVPSYSRFFLSEELAALKIPLLVEDLDAPPPSDWRHLLQACDLTVLLFRPEEAAAVAAEAAACFGLPLCRHEESCQRASEFCHNTGGTSEIEIALPRGCQVFPNEQGCFPGFALSRYGCTLLVLPEHTGELIPLFSHLVAPFLAQLTGQPFLSHTVGIFGLSEQSVRRRLADLLPGTNPSLSLYFQNGECLLRLTAHAQDGEDGEAMCTQMIAAIRNRLGAAVYGVDSGSLPQAVVSLLREKGLKIATAESCTAGLLSGMLTSVPGVSAVFDCGVAAYSCEIKQSVLQVPQELLDRYGAISPQTASAMAQGVRRLSGADIGLAITGAAGPDPSEGKPVGTVYIALADDTRTWVKLISGYDSFERDAIRQLAAASTLDLARRYLEALPAVMAGGERQESITPPVTVPRQEALVTPQKGRRAFFKRIALVALAALLLVAMLSSYFLLWHPLSNQWNFDRLKDLYTELPQSSVDISQFPEGMLPQFYSLYSQNPEVRGWLTVEGTAISYPVMDSADQKYVDCNFDGQASSYGVPFFSENNAFFSAQSVNRSLTVYGNNPNDGQMFSSLTDYLFADTLMQNNRIQLDTLYRSASFTVCAVLLTTSDTENADYFDVSRNTFTDDEDFLAFWAQLQKRSLFSSSVTVEADDSLLLLCTDVSNQLLLDHAQLVVVARREHADDAQTAVTVSENRSVSYPSSWRKSLKGRSFFSYLANRKRFLLSVDSPKQTTTTTSPTSPSTDPSHLPGEEAGGSESLDDITDNDLSQGALDVFLPAVPATSSTTTTTTIKTAATTTTASRKTTRSTTTRKSTVLTSSSSTTAKPASSSTKATASSQKPTVSSGTAAPSSTVVTPPKGTLHRALFQEADYLSLFRLKDSVSGTLLTVSDREDLQLALFYLVKKELGSASSMVKSTEAQKAQAVISYSYVLKYCSQKKAPYTFAFPTYDASSANDRKIYEAVGQVLGVKILDVSAATLEKQLCETMYYSSSPGATATNSQVYTSSLAYLRSVPSPYDNEACIRTYFPGYAFSAQTTVNWNTLLQKLATTLNIEVADIKAESNGSGLPLYATEWDGGEGNYVAKTNLYYEQNGKKTYIRGYTIRRAWGTGKLRSHAFTVTAYDEKTGNLTLQTKGWGHGVGMSQTGAVGFANEAGWTYDQILRHYYSISDTSDCQLVAPRWT